MSYHVKEIFYTLQGEGIQAGRAAVFLRFAGCNLWSGREEDRHRAICRFCDTDFVGGEPFAYAGPLALRVQAAWDGREGRRFVVITGGEPGLQLDQALVDELHALNFEVAVETNGTKPLPRVDWLTVSPKMGTEVIQRQGNELKVVVPQAGLDLDAMAEWDFRYFLVQPMDGNPAGLSTAIAWAMARPKWRISLQTHKLMGVR